MKKSTKIFLAIWAFVVVIMLILGGTNAKITGKIDTLINKCNGSTHVVEILKAAGVKKIYSVKNGSVEGFYDVSILDKDNKQVNIDVYKSSYNGCEILTSGYDKSYATAKKEELTGIEMRYEVFSMFQWIIILIPFVVFVIRMFGKMVSNSIEKSIEKEQAFLDEYNATFVLKKVEYNDGIDNFIQSEKCNIFLQEKGILITNLISEKTATLKYSKIVACGVFNDKQISKSTIQKNGSVVGRGALGGFLFGPVGAIVGGMSGINSKTQTITDTQNTYYLIINYKKTKTSAVESISFKTMVRDSDFKELSDKINENIISDSNLEL